MSRLLRMAFTQSQRIYSIWNSADKTAVTLTGSDLIATNTGTNAGVRGTVSKAAGKHYWELTIGTLNYCVMGIANAAFPLGTTPIGQSGTGLSIGYAYNGQIIKNNTLLTTVTAPTAGNVIGFALDLGGLTVDIYKQNVLQYTVTGLSAGTYFAAFGEDGIGTTGAVTGNFGASALTYTPPAGYNSGLYN